ncbi:Calcium/proton exchanger CAX-like [Purpureocillium takamizusanense]|uniref:Vacuolar calcium ion transporter n=1 Tax=Purpureocillium takamizusanense TaxID=2060973 RepID=A0A9Q8V855_9HYPO|nr:Calcium/proton exchanger CAX-like [Purpureocillium takamizusanense]UNI15529.1 Calcium/proton exchanger CAX-like [Purpureocillium takamizusanense]
MSRSSSSSGNDAPPHEHTTTTTTTYGDITAAAAAAASETTPLLNEAQQRHELMKPRRPLLVRAGQEAWRAFRATLFCSGTNVLLVCVPLGLMAGGWGWPEAAVFVLNFLAMLPLASILTFATEQLAAAVGSVAGGLINATFGNAVEMIVGISALREGEVAIVQSSMIGSILSSIMLILGTSFLLAGLGKRAVEINADIGGILTSLMIISCASLIMPSALDIVEAESPAMIDSNPSSYVLALSRFTSLILLAFYIVYLYFQSVSHAHLFIEEEEEDDEPQDKLHPLSSCVVLILSTLGVGACSDRLVDSIDGFVETLGVSRSFIGLIIVPIVGNLGCFVGTIQWSRTNRINLAVSVIVGSTLQISLFVVPFLVIVGWIIGKNMSLQFDTFETIILTLSTLVVSCLLRGGETNYFEGLLLVATYVIIGIAFFVHPGAAVTATIDHRAVLAKDTVLAAVHSAAVASGKS